MDSQHLQGEGVSQEAGEGQRHHRLDQRDLSSSDLPQRGCFYHRARNGGCWEIRGTLRCTAALEETEEAMLQQNEYVPSDREASDSDPNTVLNIWRDQLSPSVPRSFLITIPDQCNQRPRRWRAEPALDATTGLTVPNVPLRRRRFSSTAWMCSVWRFHQFHRVVSSSWLFRPLWTILFTGGRPSYSDTMCVVIIIIKNWFFFYYYLLSDFN